MKIRTPLNLQAAGPICDAGRMVCRYIVSGRVQGVGFRWFVSRVAGELALRGWVRNTEEGSVELVAAGPQDALNTLRQNLEHGPRGSRVDHVEIHLLEEHEAASLPAFRIDGAW